MINIYLKQLEKKFLEIILDEGGCDTIIDSIASLKIIKPEKVNIPVQNVIKPKQGYIGIKNFSIEFLPSAHIAETDYNIQCSLVDSKEINICLTSEGTQELLDIIKYIKYNNDHFHLYGGFDLYTDENDSFPGNLLTAITIYNILDY
jgi:hypothetical protein